MNKMSVTNDQVRTGMLRSIAPETGAEYSVVVASPRSEPELWREYLAAGDLVVFECGRAPVPVVRRVRAGGEGTAMFFAVLDTEGKVVGGLRVQPRLEAAAQSHALVEWVGQPGQVQLVNAIEERLHDGIVEVKTAWVDERSAIAGSVAGQLSRLGLVIMEMSGVEAMMATAADHVLRRWQSGGGRLDESVSATPFPDDRYRTRLMWWDRARLDTLTSPETWRRMRREADALQAATTQRPLVRLSMSTKSAGRR